MSQSQCVVCLGEGFVEVFKVKDHSISEGFFTIKECPNCGLRVTDDAPDEENCGRYYQSQSYISHSDSQEGIINKVYHLVRQVMLGVKARICSKKGVNPSLLDVGSGTGYFPHYMKKRGFDVMGIEVDENARKYSQNKFDIEVNTPKDLLNGKIEKKFGYITLWHVLEHLYGLEDFLEVFKKRLDDNGQLIIAVPNYLSYDAEKYKEYWAAYDVPRHLWHFTPQTIDVLADKYGFHIVKKKSMPFDPFYNSMLSSKYREDLFPLMTGFFIGFVALIKGWINVDKASSIIYILEKR